MAERRREGTAIEGRQPSGQAGALPTEKPVAISRRLSEYVVTVEDSTGFIVKIEKLDPRTGNRKEFSREEYATAYAYASYAAPYYGLYAASMYDPLSHPAAQAYLKTLSAYSKAFTGKA